MANPWRGEVEVIVDGVCYPARLTLGALAELEADLGADSLMALVERFEKQAFRATDILALLAAGLRAAQWHGTIEELRNADIKGGPLGAAKSAALLLARAFSHDV